MVDLTIGDEKFEVKEGNEIIEECTKASIPFGCQDGMCGTCVIDVLDGKENLGELTQQEKDLDLNNEKRLACQCKIKGNAKIKGHYS
jgi:ferredoxin|tara:strand:- start:19941 stop:20201 length:261 start_codon:yes stop_codon:yes gene_type:complete